MYLVGSNALSQKYLNTTAAIDYCGLERSGMARNPLEIVHEAMRYVSRVFYFLFLRL